MRALISSWARRTLATSFSLPRAASVFSSSDESAKCAATASFPGEVTISSSSAPAAAASAATSSMPGVSTTGSSSFGHRLRGRQETGAQTGRRDHRGAERVHDLETLSAPLRCRDACPRLGSPGRQRDMAHAPARGARGVAGRGARRPGRGADRRCAAPGRRRGRTDLRVRAGGVGAGWPDAGIRAGRRRARGAAADRAAASVGRWSGPGSTAPSPVGRWGCASRPAPGSGSRRSARRRWCWCPGSPSTGAASDSAAARATTTGRSPSPVRRSSCCCDDDELVERLPADPHDHPVTAALLPKAGLVTLGKTE